MTFTYTATLVVISTVACDASCLTAWVADDTHEYTALTSMLLGCCLLHRTFKCSDRWIPLCAYLACQHLAKLAEEGRQTGCCDMLVQLADKQGIDLARGFSVVGAGLSCC